MNHQHDTVYSLNFGLRLLARTINEDQWRSAIDYSLPEGARISVRNDDRGSHIIRYILIRTEHSFRRVTYMYRPGEPEPEYDANTQFRLAEPIQAIPSDTRLVVPPVDITITVGGHESEALAPRVTYVSSLIQIENAWQHAISLV